MSCDGLLACGVDLCEYHLVELAERIGEVAVEVACASVEVGLEYGCDMAALVEFAYALCALVYLLGVVCVVGEQDVSAVVYLEVEASVYAAVCLHAVLEFFGCASGELCHCHCCDAVVDVDGHGLSELYVSMGDTKSKVIVPLSMRMFSAWKSPSVRLYSYTFTPGCTSACISSPRCMMSAPPGCMSVV